MAISDRYIPDVGHYILSLSGRILNELEENFDGRNLEASSAKKEIVTKADNAIENAVIGYLKSAEIPANIDGEEKRRTVICENPQGLIVLDPLDGTFNYFKNRGLSLPYCTIVSIFDSPNPATLGEAVWAGMREQVSGIKIYSHADKVRIEKNGYWKETKTSGRKTLEGEIEANIMLDYGPSRPLSDYQKFEKIIKNSWTKNVSCAGFHLAGVATGTFDAYICPVQKPEELVAGIPLIEKAGGKVLTFDGKDASKLPYDFDARYAIVAASTEELAEELVGIIGK